MTMDPVSLVVASAALEFVSEDPARMTAFLAWTEQSAAGATLPAAEFEAGVQAAHRQLRQAAIRAATEKGGF